MRSERKQFVVLGLGQFGRSVAENLCRMGYEVLGVDSDEEMVDLAAPVVTQAVQANATDEEALESLGLGNFDAAIVAIGANVRDSILVTVLCKEKGVPYVAAKAVDDLHAKVLQKVGADRVIFPERDMGQRVARSLVTPDIVDLVDLSDDYEIAEVLVPNGWCGHTLLEVNVRQKYGVSLIAIRREKELIASPGSDTVIRSGDVLVVLGKTGDIDDIQ